MNNHIYRVEWYNEDSYGTTGYIVLIFQGDEMEDQDGIEKALRIAKNLSYYSNVDFDSYDKVKIEDITSSQVLCTHQEDFIVT